MPQRVPGDPGTRIRSFRLPHQSCGDRRAQFPTRLQRRNQNKSKAAADQWVSRSELEMSNAKFEKYYKAQGIIPLSDSESNGAIETEGAEREGKGKGEKGGGDEWNLFMKALREPLPSTFRITGNRLYVSSPLLPCFLSVLI